MSQGVAPSLYFRFTWQLQIVLAGVLMVASGVGRPVVVLPYLMLAFLLVSPLGASLRRWRRSLSFGLGMAIVTSFIYQMTTFSGVDGFVTALIELITGALPLLMLQANERRSQWLAALNIVIIAVGSISLAASPLVYATFIAFMVVYLLGLNAANLHLPDESGQRLTGNLYPGYFRQFFYVVPIGLLAAAAIFVLFPRARTFSLGFGAGVKAKTGYSGVIDLSGGGEIEASEEVAFLVEGADSAYWDKNGANMLFRGDALDDFDGGRWTASDAAFKPQDAATDLRLVRARHAEVSDFTVHREPTHELALFYPGSLVSAQAASAGVGQLVHNSSGSLARQNTKFDAFDYSLRVAAVGAPARLGSGSLAALAKEEALAPAEAQSIGGPLTAAEFARFLKVPAVVSQAPYFAAWRTELGLRPDQASLATVVEDLRGHFESKFTASMANEFSQRDTLAAFLSTDRRGHCEYFASATTLLMRSLGIPARVVVGYKGGVFNPVLVMLEVREANAHAWSEIYVPGSGWMPLDLMPAAPAGASPSAARLYFNAVAYLFRQYVVDYNFDSQQNLIRAVSDFTVARSGLSQDWRAELALWRRPFLVFVLLAGALGGFLWRRRSMPERGDVPLFYVRFARRMAKAGNNKGQGETYRAFHERLRQGGAPLPLVNAVDAALEREIYRGQTLGADEKAEILALIAQ